MKISTKVECGIIAITDIAMNSKNGETVTVYSISSRRNISGKYLEQILTSLRQFRLIKGMKGSKGGYVLAKPAEQITFKEIIDALDSSVLNNEISEVNENNSEMTQLISDLIWNKIEKYVTDFSSSIKLSDMINLYNETVNESAYDSMYYI